MKIEKYILKINIKKYIYFLDEYKKYKLTMSRKRTYHNCIAYKYAKIDII